MEYVIMLWPHANSRYQQASAHLAQSELELILEKAGAKPFLVSRERQGGLEWLRFEGQALDPAQLEMVGDLSLLYLLAERRPDGSLMPVMARASGALGDDLAGVLKYKGKTNELFTQMLINAALYSSDFYRKRERLSFCDPLCGRGTGLYQAANRRWDALGVDMDKNDINEAQQYFKRYLEYHKIKHQFAQRSLTFQGKQCATEKNFEYYLSAADAKQKKSARLSMILADSSQMERYLKPERFHIMAADLPYGVQHAPGQRGGLASFEQMLKGALKQWLKVLKPGGALALAFNTYTLRRAALSEWMAQAGFEVMTGGAYEGFEHWVEQAVNRDVLVGKRP